MSVDRIKYFIFKSTGSVILLAGTVVYIETKSIISAIIAIIGIGLILFGGYYKEEKLESNFNNEKEHFKTLITMYKYTGGIVALLIGIAAWIIGGNINEVKNNAKNEIDNFKNELAEIQIKSQEAIKQSRIDAADQNETIRNNIKLFLDLTKDITSIQIETIREDARNLALSSARSRIEEVFRSTNLQDEIEVAAREEIGEKLEEIVKSEMERSTKLFEDFRIITELSVKLSSSMLYEYEDRTAIDKLDSLSQFATNLRLRNAAEKTLLDRGIEFERGISPGLMTKHQKSIYNPDSIFSSVDSIKIEQQLIDSIYTVKNVWKVSYSFVILRNFSGRTLSNFDFNAVRRIREKLNSAKNGL